VTVTVLVSRQPLSPEDLAALRSFCTARGFDLCYLEGLTLQEDCNRFHVLEEPYYLHATQALLGPRREEFLTDYLFNIAATTDDRPYFFHFLRWRALGTLRARLGRHQAAYMELGPLLLGAALLQTTLLSLLVLLLSLAVLRTPAAAFLPAVPAGPPHAGGVGSTDAAACAGDGGQTGVTAPLRRCRRRSAPFGLGRVAGYFALIGAGFMLLEMAFLQKLILYLAHPVYAAAVAIAGFLVFAGAGSQLSGWWRPKDSADGNERAESPPASSAGEGAAVSGEQSRLSPGPISRAAGTSTAAAYSAKPGGVDESMVICVAGSLAAGLALACALGLDWWLALTQAGPPWLRFAVGTLTLAPLALAMGHMFPCALRCLAGARPGLVPFAWAVNGCASVMATVATPLLAMNIGFCRVALVATACYAGAVVLRPRRSVCVSAPADPRPQTPARS
jgi:hypothetical protein